MPVAADKLNHPGSCSIAFQQHDAPLPIHCIKGLPKIKEDTIKWLELEVQELLSQFNFDDRGASPAYAATAVEAVMQLDGIQSVINHLLDALPNGLQKPNPTVIPPAFWNQNNDGPKKLAWDHAVGPRCLNQSNKKGPTIPCVFSSLAFRVLLPSHVVEPLLVVFSAHAGCTRRSAVGELANCLPQLAV